MLVGLDNIGHWTNDDAVAFSNKVQQQLDLFKANGGNFFSLLTGATTDPNWDRLQILKTECDARQIGIELQNCACFDSRIADWIPRIRFFYDEPAGIQTEWINGVKLQIQSLQPTHVCLWTELLGDTDDMNGVSYDLLTRYIDFLHRAMDEYKTVKPDLKFTATGVPFPDPATIARDGRLSKDIALILHYYYSFGNENPTDPNNPFGNWMPEQTMYWYATTENDLVLAKQEWEKTIRRSYIPNGLSGFGYDEVTSLGYKYYVQAIGTNTLNPNASRFVSDAVSWCKSQGLDYVLSGNAYQGWQVQIPPRNWIFNTDLAQPIAFNDCGLAWAALQATPDLTIPLVVLASTALGLGVSRII